MTTTIIVLIAAAIFGALWVFGHSMRKTLERMENESEDAYWRLREIEKIIDEAEIEDEEKPLTL